MNAQRPDKDKKRADWRKAPAAASSGPVRYRRPTTDYTRHLIVGTCAMGIVCALGYFIYLGLSVEVPTPMLALGVHYGDDLPPNALMAEDLDALTAIDPVVAEVETQQLDPDGNLVAKLAAFQPVPGGPMRTRITGRGGAILVYLSAHGAVNRRGQPCLLIGRPQQDSSGRTGDAMPGFDPWNCDTWMTAAELFERIAPNSSRSNVKKVVLLDTGKIVTAWNLGIMVNDFTERLGEIASQHPDLVLITAQSGAAEKAWSAPELGHSVFGYFVARGLAGGANGNRDRDISLHELFQYVQSQVQHYVGMHYGVVQTPRLFPPLEEIDDFALAFSPTQPNTAPTRENQAKTMLDRYRPLQQLWSRARRWSDAADTPPLVTDPVAWTQLQTALVQADHWFLAGREYQSAWQRAAADVEKILDRLEQRGHEPPVTPYLPVSVRVLHEPAQPAAQASWQDWLKQQQQPAAPPPPVDGQSPAEGPPPPPRLPVHVATQVVWESLQGGPVTRQDLEFAIQFVQLSRDTDDGRDPPELALLKLLFSYVDSRLFEAEPQVMTDVLHQLLQVHTLAWRAGAPADPRVEVFAHALRDACDQRLRMALDDLLVGGAPALQRALQALRGLSADGPEGYPQVLTSLDEAAYACAVHDRLLTQVPRLAEWVARYDGPVHERFNELLIQVQRLHRQMSDSLALAAPEQGQVPSEAAGSEQVVQTVENLFAESQRLEAEYQKCVGTVAMQSPADYFTRLFLAHLHEPRDEWMRDYIDSIQQLPQPPDRPDDKAMAVTNDNSMPDRLQKLDPLGTLRAHLPRWDFRGAGSAAPGADAHDLEGFIRDRLSTTENRYNDQRREMDEALRSGKWRPVVREHDWSMRSELLMGGDRRRDGEWFRQQTYDPTALARELARADILLQQGRRMTEDAWGAVTWPSSWNPPPQKYPQDIETAYFSRAAGDLLLAAQAMLQGLANLSNRELFVASPISVESLARALTQPLSQRKEQLGAWTTPARYSDGRMVFTPPYQESARATLWYAATQQSSGLAWDCQLADGESQNLAKDRLVGAVALYRGHVRPVEESVARVTRWQPPGRQSTINVLPDNAASASVMFVLDCSGSMKELIDGQSRMKFAKDALTDTLSQLRSLGEETGGSAARIKAGLMAYGFRMRWPEGADAAVPNAIKDQFFPDQQVTMSRDVETLVPMQAIRTASDDVATWVGRLGPSGFTPLYYSIQLALQQRPSHLIVITDGENSPDGFKNPQLTEQDRSDLKQIQSASQDTVVHVILFGASTAQARLERDLKANGNKNIHIYYADNYTRLLNLLRVSLDLMEYQVGDNAPATLGNKAILQMNRPGVPQDVQVAVLRPSVSGGTTPVAERRLPLEGDEDLLFRLQGSGSAERQLLAYDEPRLQLPQEAGPFQLGLDYQLRQGVAEFFVTVRDAQPFTPRPQQIWAEIVPRSSESRAAVGAPFVFLDRSFRAHTHRPELQLRVDGWPDQADRATVRVWLKPTLGSPNKEAGLAELPLNARGITFTAQPQSGGSQQLIIEELHADAATVGRNRVDLAPMPAEIERRWYMSENPVRVRHVFTLAGPVNAEQLRVQFTSLESFRQDAVAAEWEDITISAR